MTNTARPVRAVFFFVHSDFLCYNRFMKKLIAFFLVIITSGFLFAEQPFFLKNWIVPEDFEWGTGKLLLKIPGKTYYQIMDYEVRNPSLTFVQKKKSNVDFPPYFVENNLITWDMTHAQIISAFKDNELFFTDSYVYPIEKDDNLSDGIELLDVVKIICRQDKNFEIRLMFEHSKNQMERDASKIDYCTIYYYKDGLDSNISKKEIFETKYKDEWEKNSLEEKAIIALSFYLNRNNDFLPSKYDLSVTMDNKKADPAAKLQDAYSISNREELIQYVKTSSPAYNEKNYSIFYENLVSNPDKTVLEISEEKNYSVFGVSSLFFVDSMKNHIGKNGITIFSKIRNLFVLRLGAGAGYITREESVEYARPIVEEILKQYVSYEDFSAHFAASESYLGISSSKFIKWPLTVMKYYNDVEEYISIDELNFTGSDADTPLSFDDAYYKPVDEALWWTSVQKESEQFNGQELSAIKEGMAKYGSVSCLDKLLKKIDPKRYDQDSGEATEDFFKKNYKKIWNKLSENEQYAIAFSSNLFELNLQYHHDFDGKVTFSKNSADPKKLLSNDWDIESHDDLVQTFYNLEESGHSGSYQGFCDILDRHPGQNLFEIAEQEHLTIMETCRLCFVNDTKDITGAHGIEAWDEGREITILRWGIACGYISSEEAMTLIEPVIKRIRQNYVSFEDYMSHYIIGRQFFGLYEGNYEKRGTSAKNATIRAAAYIPFNELDFTAENADKNKAMTYDNCMYIPSADFLKWEKVMNVYRQDDSEELLAKLDQLEKEMPEFKNIIFAWHLSLLYDYSTYKSMVEYAESNMNYMNGLAGNNQDYSDVIYSYILALNNTFQPDKAIEFIATLPEDFQFTIHLYYQYGYANYLMLNKCSTQLEYEAYRQRAIEVFNLLKKYNYELPVMMQSWLEIVF